MQKSKNIEFKIGIVFGILVLAYNSFAFIKNIELIQSGIEIEGRVVYVENDIYGGSHNSIFTPGKIPRVLYVLNDGKQRYVQSCNRCNVEGEIVSVLYNPTNPDHASINSNYLYTPLYYSIGAIFYLLILLFFLKKRKSF